MSGHFSKEVWEQLKTNTTTKTKDYRGLTEETVRVYGVRQEFNSEGQVENQYYPITKNRNHVAVKKRIVLPEKDFRSIGPVDATCDLFGRAIFETSPAKSIIIASGELDALSIFQMMEDQNKLKDSKYESTPVVSAIMGESSSLRQYQANYDFLNRFEKIYICPDQDSRGIEALHKIAKVLPRDKLFVIELPLKDANEMLVKGKQKEFIGRFFKASHYSPAGILGSDVITDRILERAKISKVAFPPFLSGLNEMLAGGLEEGTIANIVAGSRTWKNKLNKRICSESFRRVRT